MLVRMKPGSVPAIAAKALNPSLCGGALTGAAAGAVATGDGPGVWGAGPGELDCTVHEAAMRASKPIRMRMLRS